MALIKEQLKNSSSREVRVNLTQQDSWTEKKLSVVHHPSQGTHMNQSPGAHIHQSHHLFLWGKKCGEKESSLFIVFGKAVYMIIKINFQTSMQHSLSSFSYTKYFNNFACIYDYCMEKCSQLVSKSSFPLTEQSRRISCAAYSQLTIPSLA